MIRVSWRMFKPFASSHFSFLPDTPLPHLPRNYSIPSPELGTEKSSEYENSSAILLLCSLSWGERKWTCRYMQIRRWQVCEEHTRGTEQNSAWKRTPVCLWLVVCLRVCGCVCHSVCAHHLHSTQLALLYLHDIAYIISSIGCMIILHRHFSLNRSQISHSLWSLLWLIQIFFFSEQVKDDRKHWSVH